MSFRTLLIVFLALVSGGSAAIGISKYRDPDASAPKADTVPVAVAKVDIPRGETITADQVEIEQYLKAPPGATDKVENVLERSVYAPLLKGEPILEKKLAPKGGGRGLGALIPKGMRAISIQTPTIASAGGGFILPGSKVDVLLIPNGQASNDFASLILKPAFPVRSDGSDILAALVPVVQNVQVWAVGPRVEAPAENRVDVKELHEVTLLVSPEQATALTLAQNRGSLHLTLRNPEDNAVVVLPRGFVLNRPTEKAPETQKAETKPPEPVQIRTLHGGQDSVVFVQSAPAPARSVEPERTASGWLPFLKGLMR
jgi:pilus assembly protein CpaB